MENFQYFLLVLQIIIAVLMIILVLIQKSDGDNLGGIGGGSGGLGKAFSAKASANFLTKTTMILVAIFMLNCMILAKISNASKEDIASKLDEVLQENEVKSEQNNINKAPKVD